MQMKFYSPLTADFFPNEPDYEDEFYDEYEGYPQDCFVLEDDRVSVQTASRTPPPKEPRTHDFER